MKRAKELAGEVAVSIGILLMLLYAAMFFWVCRILGIDLNDDF